jgi:hypothetical protein
LGVLQYHFGAKKGGILTGDWIYLWIWRFWLANNLILIALLDYVRFPNATWGSFEEDAMFSCLCWNNLVWLGLEGGFPPAHKLPFLHVPSPYTPTIGLVKTHQLSRQRLCNSRNVGRSLDSPKRAARRPGTLLAQHGDRGTHKLGLQHGIVQGHLCAPHGVSDVLLQGGAVRRRQGNDGLVGLDLLVDDGVDAVPHSHDLGVAHHGVLVLEGRGAPKDQAAGAAVEDAKLSLQAVLRGLLARELEDQGVDLGGDGGDAVDGDVLGEELLVEGAAGVDDGVDDDAAGEGLEAVAENLPPAGRCGVGGSRGGGGVDESEGLVLGLL